MEYVYIMSCQRGQSLPEIFSMWDSYEKAIIAYYNYHVNDDDYTKPKSDSWNYWFMYLYKFPLNQPYCTNKWCDIKLGKSCKYRVKLKNWGELRTEFIQITITENRDKKITELGI